MRFPPLRPQEEIPNVLKTMDPIDLMAVSFSSPRIKNYVKSMKLKTPIIELVIDVSSGLMFQLPENIQWHLRKRYGRKWEGTDDLNEHVNLYSNRRDFLNTGWTVKTWINHFIEIFGKPHLDSLCIRKPVNRFDLLGLKTVVGDVSTIRIMLTYNAELYDTLFTVFPSVKTLKLVLDATFNANINNITFANLDRLYLNDRQQSLVKLDDLLECNSKLIHLQYSNFTEKDLNRFLRHWRRGSNPRLTILRILWIRATPLNQDRVLTGINAQEAGINREKIFEVYDAHPAIRVYTVFGGMEIRTKLGRVGTIKIGMKGNNEMEFTFYVSD